MKLTYTLSRGVSSKRLEFKIAANFSDTAVPDGELYDELLVKDHVL